MRCEEEAIKCILESKMGQSMSFLIQEERFANHKRKRGKMKKHFECLVTGSKLQFFVPLSLDIVNNGK